MLHIKIKSLGNIKEANIKLNKLTIFSGENNSGKTYVNYLLYALLDKKSIINSNVYENIINQTKENGIYELNITAFLDEYFQKLKTNFEKHFVLSLDRFFSATQGTFKETKIEILQDIQSTKQSLFKQSFEKKLKVGKNNNTIFEISKKEDSEIIVFVIKESNLPNDIYLDFISNVFFEYIFSDFYKDVFILPAERTGLNLFYQELNTNRNALINHLQKTKINPIEVIKDLIISKYPQPIADYIDFLNNAMQLKKNITEFKDINNILHNKIIRGKYQVTNEGISFLPYKTYFKGNDYKSKIDLHLASSTAKTMFSLEFYIEHMAKKDGYLIIDEPELNLHPDNQRKIARVIALLINNGIKVILSTHSDYIIRELNNLIMLKDEFKSKKDLMKKYEYVKDELLSKDDVTAYLVDKGIVTLMETDPNEGIIASTFDKVINNLNNSSDDIYYTKMEDLENE